MTGRPWGQFPSGRFQNLDESDANLSSVVLWLEIGTYSILLGSDLEYVPGEVGLGWQAVVSTVPPNFKKSSIFKVAHHGSPNGDCAQIWNSLIDTNSPPTLVCTPYSRGHGRPQKDDIQRLLGKSSELFITSHGRMSAGSQKRNKRMSDLISCSRVKDLTSDLNGGYLVVSPDGRNLIRVDTFNGAKKCC